MARKQTSAWVGGAAFASVLVMAAGWLLLVSPTRADAGDVRTQAQGAREQNDMLDMQLAALRADHEKLDEYRAELETLRTQVPRDLRDTDLVRELEAAATAAGVTVDSITVMAPAIVAPVSPTPQEAPAAPVQPAEGEAEGGAEGDEFALPPAPTGPQAPNGMVAVELVITVKGNPDAVTGFLASVQEGLARLVLVTGFDFTVLEDQGAQGGQAAVAAGDWQAAVRGTAFVLPPPQADAPAAGGDTATEAPVNS